MNNSNDDKAPINNVEWDEESESYKVVPNPSWDIGTQTEVYSDLIQQGFGDKISTSIIEMLNTVRPVYRCYCVIGDSHDVPGYSFNPCPCFDCKMQADREGEDITKPLFSMSLHKNSLHVLGSMIREEYMDQINEKLAEVEFHVTEKHVKDFQFLLSQYGETQKSWNKILDEFEVNDSEEEDQYWMGLIYLEQFWLHLAYNIRPELE